MSAKQLYYGLLGIIGLSVIMLLAAAYAANSVLESRSKQLYEAQLQTEVLDAKQRQVAKARADIEKYRSVAEIAKSIVPQDKDQAQTVREIVQLAETNGIRLGAITFPTSSLGGASKVPATSSKTALSQLKPVPGIAGVYSLEIVVQSDASFPASYARFVQFLDALEHNRRTALVKGITLQPDVANPGNVSFTLTVQEYIKP